VLHFRFRSFVPVHRSRLDFHSFPTRRSSDLPSVASVSNSGLVKGVAAGGATITATSEGKSGTAAVTVTVARPGTVSDLVVAGVTDSSVTLAFTEVSNGVGGGGVARDDVRFAV